MPNPATTPQRQYLEALMSRADITWDSLTDAANVQTRAADPWSKELTADQASTLIDYLKEQRS